MKPNLTEPNRTCKNSQKHRKTEPMNPPFRGVQVRFGSAPFKDGFNGDF